MKDWTMPLWMEKYRSLINNTGGNSIEDLVNDDGTNSNVFNNAPRALICVAVKSQVTLLQSLHEITLTKNIREENKTKIILVRATQEDMVKRLKTLNHCLDTEQVDKDIIRQMIEYFIGALFSLTLSLRAYEELENEFIKKEGEK